MVGFIFVRIKFYITAQCEIKINNQTFNPLPPLLNTNGANTSRAECKSQHEHNSIFNHNFMHVVYFSEIKVLHYFNCLFKRISVAL